MDKKTTIKLTDSLKNNREASIEQEADDGLQKMYARAVAVLLQNELAWVIPHLRVSEGGRGNARAWLQIPGHWRISLRTFAGLTEENHEEWDSSLEADGRIGYSAYQSNPDTLFSSFHCVRTDDFARALSASERTFTQIKRRWRNRRSK